MSRLKTTYKESSIYSRCYESTVFLLRALQSVGEVHIKEGTQIMENEYEAGGNSMVARMGVIFFLPGCWFAQTICHGVRLGLLMCLVFATILLCLYS